MGEVIQVELVKLFCGIIAVDDGALALAGRELAGRVGEIDLEGDVIPFDFTNYYSGEMGDGLLRQFVAFKEPVCPGRLAEIKVLTNEIERNHASEVGGTLRRRINLDPGYIAPAKVVLATTKDFAHRIYLRDGIYAEVTLNFGKTGFRYFDWTYPDFRAGRYDEFLKASRRSLMDASRRTVARPQPGETAS